MLKPVLVGLSLVAALGALSGCASSAARDNKVAMAANWNPDCVKETGTRIKQPADTCVNVPGSSYSQEELERTGQIDLGAALRQLDPRLR